MLEHQHAVGVRGDYYEPVQYGFFAAIPASAAFTGDMFVRTFQSLAQMPQKVVSLWSAVTGGERVFTGFIRDLTERRRTEERLESLQSELIHVSRVSAMGTMASTIAHELNQPITAITNYAESPIAKSAHVVLNSTSQGSHLLGENAASRIAQLNILDALFVAIAKKDLKRAEKNLMKTQHAVQDLREF